jgi:hypothetical protein
VTARPFVWHPMSLVLLVARRKDRARWPPRHCWHETTARPPPSGPAPLSQRASSAYRRLPRFARNATRVSRAWGPRAYLSRAHRRQRGPMNVNTGIAFADGRKNRDECFRGGIRHRAYGRGRALGRDVDRQPQPGRVIAFAGTGAASPERRRLLCVGNWSVPPRSAWALESARTMAEPAGALSRGCRNMRDEAPWDRRRSKSRPAAPVEK